MSRRDERRTIPIRPHAEAARLSDPERLELQRLQEMESAYRSAIDDRDREIDRLTRIVIGLADRVVGQSEALSRAAERLTAPAFDQPDATFAPDVGHPPVG